MPSSSDLLPPHATPRERAFAALSARWDALVLPEVWNAARCPLSLLPWLAWALSIESWDSTWPEAAKRAALAEALRYQREKGTPAGLRRLLELHNLQVAVVQEWFEDGYSGSGLGEPFHFRITIQAAQQVSEDDLRLIRRLALIAGNVRSVFDAIQVVAVQEAGPVYFGGGVAYRVMHKAAQRTVLSDGSVPGSV